jgi:hypothetical protein
VGIRARVVSVVAAASAILAVLPSGCGGALYDDGTTHANDAGDAPYARHDSGHRDVTWTDDGAGSDDGAIPCDQGVCPSPADVSGFSPAWKPPTGAHQNKCTPQMLDEFFMSCLSTNGTQSCTPFVMGDAAHQACGQCLQSQFADAAWGPLVYAQDDVETNTAGCIVLLDPSQTDCAKALEALAECQHAGCDNVCGGSSAAGFDLFVRCTSAANTCGCRSYFDASQCQKEIAAGGGPAAPCLVGQTFEDFYYATAAVFCGP